MQLIGATPLELRLLYALRFCESQPASTEATISVEAISDAIRVLQAIRSQNPGGEWVVEGKSSECINGG